MVTNDFWWHGPKWIQQPGESHQNGNVKIIIPNTLAELAMQSNVPTVIH